MDADKFVQSRPILINIICIFSSLVLFYLPAVTTSNAQKPILLENKAEAEILSRVGKTFWVSKAPRYSSSVTFRTAISSSAGFNILEKGSFKILEFIRLDIHRPEMGLYKVQLESGEEAYIDCSQFALHLAQADALPSRGSRQMIFSEDPDLMREKRTMEMKKRLKEIEEKAAKTNSENPLADTNAKLHKRHE